MIIDLYLEVFEWKEKQQQQQQQNALKFNPFSQVRHVIIKPAEDEHYFNFFL